MSEQNDVSSKRKVSVKKYKLIRNIMLSLCMLAVLVIAIPKVTTLADSDADDSYNIEAVSNAMGTIITSSVLMIPSVIFSEATISYLGLGFQDMHSLGVILSKNQAYLSTFPHLILFPSAIMALIMISFNLFGNGLRDAFNPSLKGSE